MEENTSSTILITGASGFIGSRIVDHLSVARDYKIYGLTRKKHSSDTKIEWIEGLFADRDFFKKTLSNIKPEIVIHCAGLTPHGGRFEAEDFYKVNVDQSCTMLAAIIDHNNEQADAPVLGIVNASTLGVYGHPKSDKGVVNEGDQCMPLAPYPRSKLSFETILHRDQNLKSVTLRIANIPGRDAFVNYVLQNKKVNFFGDASYLRDYIHLDDLSRLFDAAILYLRCDDNSDSIILNAGSGIGFSFYDIVDELERQTGNVIERSHNPPKPGDVIKIICDIEKAKDALGWTPEKRNIQDIVRYAIENKDL